MLPASRGTYKWRGERSEPGEAGKREGSEMHSTASVLRVFASPLHSLQGTFSLPSSPRTRIALQTLTLHCCCWLRRTEARENEDARARVCMCVRVCCAAVSSLRCSWLRFCCCFDERECLRLTQVPCFESWGAGRRENSRTQQAFHQCQQVPLFSSLLPLHSKPLPLIRPPRGWCFRSQLCAGSICTS